MKQKKENGGSGTVETTVYLDKDFESYEFEVKTVGIGGSGEGGRGGGSPFQFCPHCGKSFTTLRYPNINN